MVVAVAGKETGFARIGGKNLRGLHLIYRNLGGAQIIKHFPRRFIICRQQPSINVGFRHVRKFCAQGFLDDIIVVFSVFLGYFLFCQVCRQEGDAF